MSPISIKTGQVLAGQRLNPDWRTSKTGYKFDRNSDVWQIDGSININLDRMRDIDETTSEGLRKALSRYAEELSGDTTNNAFGRFNAYCDFTGERNVNINGLTKWRTSLTDETEYKLGALKGFLIAWNEWGFPGVDDKVVNYLDELKLKGNAKGKSVSKACPYSGPFTQVELGALLDWVSNAFIKKIIDLTQYTYFVTLVFTGRRSVQVRALRACDLAYKEGAKGHDYIVTCPRAKQRGTGFREVFRPLAINEDLYLLLDNQAEASQAYVENVFGKRLPSEVRKQIPVFLALDRIKGIPDIEHLVASLNETPDYLHMTRDAAGQVLRDIAVKNQARSERTGEFLNFTARRFRYTKGTNLARKGIADVTEYGMCTHDYAMSPCTKGGECMICKEHACIKGMPQTLPRIKRLEEQVESQFEKAKLDAADGAFGADRWVTHLGWKLAHVRTQRERIESDNTPVGAVLWIAPEHDPSPIKRSLEQRDYKTRPNEGRVVDASTMISLLGVSDA